MYLLLNQWLVKIVSAIQLTGPDIPRCILTIFKHQNLIVHFQVYFFFVYFTHLNVILRRSQEFLNYTTVSCIMVGGDWALPRRNPSPIKGCWTTFLLTEGEEAKKSWSETNMDGMDGTPGSLRCHSALTDLVLKKTM